MVVAQYRLDHLRNEPLVSIKLMSPLDRKEAAQLAGFLTMGSNAAWINKRAAPASPKRRPKSRKV